MAQANRKTLFLLLAPSAVLLAFFILPLGVAVITSFEFPHPSLRHYQRLFSVPVYQTVYLKTLRIAFTTTAGIFAACISVCFLYLAVVCKSQNHRGIADRRAIYALGTRS